MGTLLKSRGYAMRHVEAETGISLLYSAPDDRAAFLNPVGTKIWLTTGDRFDPAGEDFMADEHRASPAIAGYVATVLAHMVERGLLHADPDGEPRHPVPSPIAEPTVPALQQIYFYVTRDCNARCYHCYQPTTKVANGARPPAAGQLGAERFLALVDDARPLGLEKVKFSGGEPLLRADLPDIMAGVGARGLRMSIETNGYLIDDRLASVLAGNEVSVSISLDGATAAVHDALRGHPGSFDRVMRALRLLSDRGWPAHVIMSVSHRNLDQVDAVLAVAASVGCKLVKLNPVNTLGRAQRLEKTQTLLDMRELLALYERRRELEARHGVFLFLEGPPAFASLSELLFGHAAICPFTNILGVLADGSISFCGVGNSFPELVLGRATDPAFDLAAFWRSHQTLRSVRAALRHPLEGVCGECMLQELCGGSCRALAYGSFGSFVSPHPWCQAAREGGLFPAHFVKPQSGGMTSCRQTTN
jgi:SynChlorMet cassette radical SAM/SPASM protein ScmF